MVLTGAELNKSYLKEAQELGDKIRQLAAGSQWLQAQRELSLTHPRRTTLGQQRIDR